jgi:TonB family protein
MTNRIILLSFSCWLMCISVSFSQGVDSITTSKKVVIAEEMPQYPGGDAALLEYISEEVRYPTECRKNGEMGIVFVTYSVNAFGDVDSVAIFHSSNALFNEEAKRVIRSIRGYKPGKQDGKPVRVKFTIPIKFVLNDGSEEAEHRMYNAIAVGYYKIALEVQSSGSDQMAIHLLGEAISNGKDWFYQAYMTRGDLQLNVKEYQKALDDYNIALGISDSLVAAWQGKGKALMALNRLDEASSAFQNALRLRPNSFDALYNLGVIRLTERKFEEGITYFSKAIEMDATSGHQLLQPRNVLGPFAQSGGRLPRLA